MEIKINRQIKGINSVWSAGATSGRENASSQKRLTSEKKEIPALKINGFKGGRPE